MVIDCSKNKISVPLSDINGDQIEMVSTHKYLGVETGDQLKQRLFFLRKLSLFRIDQQNTLAVSDLWPALHFWKYAHPGSMQIARHEDSKRDHWD